jgi:Spy/CpxP family protein refolding chaperone
MPMGGEMPMGGQMGGRMGGGPVGMLLAMKTQLELTDDQVKKLEAMRNAPKPKRNEADMLRARADMIEAQQGDGDLVKARAALDKMSKLRNDTQIARLKERQDLRAVLTSAQKTKLDNMRGAMRGRMRQRIGMRMREGGDQSMGGGMRMRQGPGGMGPGGMGPGGMGPGGMGPGGMGPGMRGNMAPGGMRQGRGGNVEEEVVIERRRPTPPLPPADSTNRP